MSDRCEDAGSFLELVGPELSQSQGWPELRCHLDAADVEHAARLLAEGIARRRIGVNERLHSAWQSKVSDPTAGSIKAAELRILEAGLLQNVGTPEAPASANHLNGLVAESIWLEVVAQVDAGLGSPIRVEGHDWSATDPGGDGLTVYAAKEAGPCFRLWESKHHGSADPIRDTVNTACRQVKSRSLSYLTRFSLIAQTITEDESLARFYGSLAELWVDRDPAAGVGISVGATDDGDDGGDCFGNVTSYFNLDAEQHQGHLHLIADFNDLARHVQIELWKGCGLWTEP